MLEEKQGSALLLRVLAHAAMQAGESARAQEQSVYSLRLAEDLWDRSGQARCYQATAPAHAHLGDEHVSAQLNEGLSRTAREFIAHFTSLGE